MDLTISTLTLESFLLVLVRTGCFTSTAPLFSSKGINARMRVLIAFCISICIYSATDVALPEYTSVLGYSMLVIKEALVGLSMGFVSTMMMAMIVVAGEFIDREIGFTMVTAFDANQNANVTITAELYDKMVYVIVLITNLHYYLLIAIAQSFELVPIGRVSVNYPVMYTNVLGYISRFYSIGFTIAMPLFLGTTILNVILGILAKTSPQMNMFSIGMQLKVISGLLLLSIAIMFVPNITNFLMERVRDALTSLIGGL